jgi:hypothetical protein
MFLLAAAIVGGLATFAVLWQFAPVMALAGAPFGGSFSALLAGLVLAFRGRGQSGNTSAVSGPFGEGGSI